MNAAHYAGKILEAWKAQDLSRFQTALNRASALCTSSRPLSHLEGERAEVLQSIVEHLRKISCDGNLAGHSRRSAAWALLSHLSLDGKPKEESEANRSIFSTKSLKFGTERAKCFVEVECRPRAYAG